MTASLRDAVVFSDIIGWRSVEAAMLGLVIVAAALAVAVGTAVGNKLSGNAP